MTAPDPNTLILKDKTELSVRRSVYRGYARLDGCERLVDDIRRVVAEGGGMRTTGAEVLPILKAAAQEEPSWPGPTDTLNDLEKAVIELRWKIAELRDDQPKAPGERPGGKISEHAWGLRHASLCGWAARLGMVGNPKYATSPLLGEAIAMREELLRLAASAQPKTDYGRSAFSRGA